MNITAEKFRELINNNFEECNVRSPNCFVPSANSNVMKLFEKFLGSRPDFSDCQLYASNNYYKCKSGTDVLKLSVDPSDLYTDIIRDNKEFDTLSCKPSRDYGIECSARSSELMDAVYVMDENEEKGSCNYFYNFDKEKGYYFEGNCEEGLPIFDKFLNRTTFVDVSRPWAYTKLAAGILSTLYCGYQTIKELKNLYQTPLKKSSETKPNVPIKDERSVQDRELDTVILEEPINTTQKSVETINTSEEKVVTVKPLPEISTTPAVVYIIATVASVAFATLPFFIALGSLGLGVLGLGLIASSVCGYKAAVELKKIRKLEKDQEILRKDAKPILTEDEKLVLNNAIYSNLQRDIKETLEKHALHDQFFGNGILPQTKENKEKQVIVLQEKLTPDSTLTDDKLRKESKKRALLYGVGTVASLVFTTMTYLSDFVNVYQNKYGTYFKDAS